MFQFQRTLRRDKNPLQRQSRIQYTLQPGQHECQSWGCGLVNSCATHLPCCMEAKLPFLVKRKRRCVKPTNSADVPTEEKNRRMRRISWRPKARQTCKSQEAYWCLAVEGWHVLRFSCSQTPDGGHIPLLRQEGEAWKRGQITTIMTRIRFHHSSNCRGNAGPREGERGGGGGGELLVMNSRPLRY